MIELFVLDENLERIGIIDSYTSLIWANRYAENGDCELYIQATDKYLNLLKKGYYLVRDDDEMVCQIKKIELETNTETGNYLIVTGYDVKSFTDQRVIWGTSNADGNVEDFVRDNVNRSLGNPNLAARQLKKANGQRMFYLGNKANFTDVTQEQVSYKNIGELIREKCQKYEWGYKVILSDELFYFQLYKGTDRSDTVIFANKFENLISSKYTEDSTNLGNVALVAGEGEGSDRARNVSGYAEGTNRYEIYVDAKDISRTITWEQLTAMYPTTDQGGHGYIYITSPQQAITYKMDIIDIQIVDDNQLTALKIAYPNGQVITKDGNTYYQIYDVIIADLESETPANNDNVILRDVVYSVYLLNRGYEKLAEYGSVISFDGTVEPNTTFIYKKDYFLGDKVTVENEFGISAIAKIVEVVEVCDDNGYSVEPKFEYLEPESDTPTVASGYLLTEQGAKILTENSQYLMRETAIIPEVSTYAINDIDSISSAEDIKISELTEADLLFDGCCFPIVQNNDTKKVTFATLESMLANDFIKKSGIIQENGTPTTENVYSAKAEKNQFDKINTTISNLTKRLDDMLNKAYPVGSIYLSVSNTNPKDLFGGTWVKMTGAFLYGAVNSVGNGNGTGTATNSHTLTEAQMPKHRHVGLYDGSTSIERKGGYGTGTAHNGTINEMGEHNWETITTGYTGSGQGHSHNIPYIGVWVWKRTA